MRQTADSRILKKDLHMSPCASLSILPKGNCHFKGQKPCQELARFRIQKCIPAKGHKTKLKDSQKLTSVKLKM